jgi:hypothetical protein
VDKAYNKYMTKFNEKQEKEKKKQQQEQERLKKEQLKTQQDQQKQSNSNAQVKELTKEEFERAKIEEELREKIAKNPELKNQIDEINKEKLNENNKEKEKETEKEEDKIAEGKIRPNKGNGANMEKYIWYQYSIQEITVIIPVDKKITGKDIKVKFDSKKLNVTVAGEHIIGGDLKNNMNVN